jgi:hypothetical protein
MSSPELPQIPDAEAELKFIREGLAVTSFTISLSIKRSVRVTTPQGDEFRTVDSHSSMTFSNSAEGNPIALQPKLAYRAAMYHTPLLAQKAIFDLVALGVMKRADAEERISIIRKLYASFSGSGNDKGRNPEPVSPAGDPVSQGGEKQPEGPGVSGRQDDGVQAKAGPSDGHPVEGEPSTRNSPDVSQVHQEPDIDHR